MSGEERNPNLQRIGVRPKFSVYIKEAWAYRELAFMLAVFENEATTANTYLGRWWLILQPALQSVIYGLVFGLILGSGRPNNFIPFLFTGTFLFTLMTGAMQAGSTIISSNRGLVTSVNFPRILLPASSTLRQTLNYVMTIPILALVLVLYRQTLTWESLFFPILIVAVVLFSFGISLLAARFALLLPDASKFVPFITRILFYTSGVFFSMTSVLAGHPFWISVVNWNPLYSFMSVARGLLVAGYQVDPHLVFTSTVWTVFACVAGVIAFWSAEEKYGSV